MLTASTSEAYSFLFKLLCNPGDAVLVPTPSYPLFDHLARLDAVETLTYDLDSDAGWRFDFSHLEDAPERVRAVVVVHPNNPTGSFVHPADADRLVSLCRDRGWALIADEVFLSYPLDGGPGDDRSFAAVEDCLCFTLGGLSKSVGLPQLKLAWIVAERPGCRRSREPGRPRRRRRRLSFGLDPDGVGGARSAGRGGADPAPDQRALPGEPGNAAEAHPERVLDVCPPGRRRVERHRASAGDRR